MLRQHLESMVFGFFGQDFSDELGVTKAAISTMFSILDEQDVPSEKLEAKLRGIAERHLKLSKELYSSSKSNHEPEISKHREAAAKAIEKGKYDYAGKLLVEALTIDLKAIDDLPDQLSRRKISAAATKALQGELEEVRLDYQMAAQYFASAASLVSTLDSDIQLAYLMRQASAYYSHGCEIGNRLSAPVAG